jgi:hypothetical protein
MLLALSAASLAQFAVSVTFAPPALPVYDQPLCPGDGYIWTPGYWAWDDYDADYYWVPGTWVLAPEVGYLWTPAWWGWGSDAYIFHEGYWGPRVGFYGGISYGFGYFGEGYEGGRWENGRFFYNRSVNNVNVTNIHNVYENRVVNENRVNRVSYNGGNGGISARPSPEQETAGRERHLPPVAAQSEHIKAAQGNRELRASVNQGRPPIAATAKPGAFNDRATAVPAREAGAPYHPPANHPPANRGNAGQTGGASANRPETNNSRPSNNASNVHVKDLPPAQRAAAPNTGNPRLDQKYQKQQAKMYTQQDKERQKLQQRQEQDHQRVAQQRDAQVKNQQLEQRHQQQTQQLQQRHEAQQQHMQQRQQPQPRQSEGRPPKGK